jgi:hypothetical protein
LEQEDDKIVATLYSDDPKEALKPNYTGNSFYLRMPLEISDAADLPQAQWQYQARSGAERDDLPYGIFLRGRQTQLQPFDVRATFARDGNDVLVTLSGQFQIIDASTTRGPVRVTPVAAELNGRIDH